MGTKQKVFRTIFFVLAGIALNHAGHAVASALSLPLWLDSVGTVIAAYASGPVFGAVVGFTSNALHCLDCPIALAYGITGATIGAVVGILARKRRFTHTLDTMFLSGLVALLSIIISTPIDLLNGSAVGNVWGDGVASFWHERGLPVPLCVLVGQLYVDFPDKVLTLVAVHLLVKLFRVLRTSYRLRVLRLLAVPLVLLPGLRRPAPLAAAEYTAYVQTLFSTANGLPCGEANDIVQAPDGMLWIGTYAGLYRYNGNEFTLVGEYDSVHNVNCLFFDPRGRLWIGTNDNGITILQDGAVVAVLDESSGLPANSVRSITRNADGTFYVGTSGSMARLSAGESVTVLATIPQVSNCARCSSDATGATAALAADGSIRLLRDGAEASRISAPSESQVFTSCFFAADGLLYAGTSRGEILIHAVQDGMVRLTETLMCDGMAQVNALRETDGGELMVCADNGIGYFDAGRRFRFIDSGAFNSSIDSMACDYQGNLWFASSRQGLLRLSSVPFTNLYGGMGMAHKVANTTAVWHGLLYVGTDRGLDIIDPELKQSVSTPLSDAMDGLRIRCIRVDSRDRLWLCTYGAGLWCASEGGSRTVYDAAAGVGNRVRTCLELSDGSVAVASDAGLSFIVDGAVQNTLRYRSDLGTAPVLSLMQGAEGDLLAGTDGDGIAVVHGGKVERWLTRADGLSSGVVMRTVPDGRGKGAFVVTSNELCYLDADYGVSRLDSFPYYNNYDLFINEAAGRQTAFIPGSAGVYVVSLDDLLASTVHVPEYEVLDSRQGLTSTVTANSWNHMDGDGNLYLSCSTGVFMVNMNRYRGEQRSYRLSVPSVKADDVPVAAVDGTFTVPRDTRKVELLPEVLNYSPEDPAVRWWLEGSKVGYTTVRQSDISSAVYTNLPAGTYTFHLAVLGSKADEVLAETTYTLRKETAIYDNWWFMAYMIVGAMLFVAWLTWFVVRTQTQRTLLLQKKELELAHQQVRMGNDTILAIAKTIDAKDETTSQHSQRVSEYSVLIARAIGFSDAEAEDLRKAALLHDIGKVGIPDRILKKPSRLTPEEYELMKSHTTKGAEILKNLSQLDHIVEGALYHHERYDGTGYPEGLAGEAIPLYGRIICVADSFDAMTANRLYRRQLGYDQVLAELHGGSGTQFDPYILRVFLDLLEGGKIDRAALYSD